MDQIKIGKFISKKRKDINLTQEELAEKLNVTAKSISRWENGKTMPDMSLFNEICNILNISLEELLSGEDKLKGSDETINYIKYQRKMYIYRLIALTIVLILIIGGILYFMFKPYKLEFSDTIDYTKPIYNIDENIKLYSKFDKNYYIRNSKIDLEEVLKTLKLLQLNKLKME